MKRVAMLGLMCWIGWLTPWLLLTAAVHHHNHAITRARTLGTRV